MRDNSVVLFSLDRDPVLEFVFTNSGPRFTVGEFGSFDGVDFYIPLEHAERVKRAVDAFNEIMREPVAQQQADAAE